MASDLERRRLAIADALRAVMAEPLPTRRVEPDAMPIPLDDRDDREDFVDGTDDELDEPFPPSVPPLEVAGGLSRTASLALFGH